MQHTDWLEIVDEIGPSFAAGADQRDANDEFVTAHFTRSGTSC